MNIIERTLNDITVLDLDGDLTMEGNVQFRARVAATIDAGYRKLIVNLAKVSYMDGDGLGEIVACYVILRRVSGHLKLLHLNDHLQHMLSITKLAAIFETFDSELEAVGSFPPRSETAM
jgi:anti-sigma B factor antagonist